MVSGLQVMNCNYMNYNNDNSQPYVNLLTYYLINLLHVVTVQIVDLRTYIWMLTTGLKTWSHQACIFTAGCESNKKSAVSYLRVDIERLASACPIETYRNISKPCKHSTINTLTFSPASDRLERSFQSTPQKVKDASKSKSLIGGIFGFFPDNTTSASLGVSRWQPSKNKKNPNQRNQRNLENSMLANPPEPRKVIFHLVIASLRFQAPNRSPAFLAIAQFPWDVNKTSLAHTHPGDPLCKARKHSALGWQLGKRHKPYSTQILIDC